MTWIKGVPPISGDTFTAIVDGIEIDIFYCPQQGWIDIDWNPIDINKITKYLK